MNNAVSYLFNGDQASPKTFGCTLDPTTVPISIDASNKVTTKGFGENGEKITFDVICTDNTDTTKPLAATSKTVTVIQPCLLSQKVQDVAGFDVTYPDNKVIILENTFWGSPAGCWDPLPQAFTDCTSSNPIISFNSDNNVVIDGTKASLTANTPK